MIIPGYLQLRTGQEWSHHLKQRVLIYAPYIRAVSGASLFTVIPGGTFWQDLTCAAATQSEKLFANKSSIYHVEGYKINLGRFLMVYMNF